MSFLKDRRIVLGITGSIAAYKSPLILRELQNKGALVRVAITPYGERFVSKLALEVLSGNSVYSEVVPESSPEIRHTSLSLWGELLLIAPATANTIAKIACGIADTPVTDLALCFGRGIVCPAMNVRMYENLLTQENLKKLKQFGWEIVEPESGYLACKEEGKGRLAEIENIVECAEYWFIPKLLRGKRVVVTAGPTREYIDPVRFISNPSSGKMGYAIAKVAKGMGADVFLVSGKTCLRPPYGVKKFEVETVNEMKDAVLSLVKDADVYISAAAIGDYTPLKKLREKLKKGEDELILRLRRTPDILKLVGEKKKRGQIVVGFAAETENLKENALKKIKTKKLDAIVANNVKSGVFGGDENNVLFISSKGEEKAFSGTKEEVAFKILQEISKLLQ
ncbi:MAG: bifunctional phosphopantothenoylcysteine decarboxylase/phosphopantothenate--cysteine ligase CoaBC [Thermovibrio sp.]|nr:MAG: bifunctional phosphopantothenoylcysteine decarboxylase/phosphopantothenate--cysteine ligase CoaBC [Thermovibrio sp.]